MTNKEVIKQAGSDLRYRPYKIRVIKKRGITNTMQMQAKS